MLTPETFPKPEMEARKTPTKLAYERMLVSQGRCAGVNLHKMMVVCGKSLFGIDIAYDHITPLWAGGKNNPENWQALCCACHQIKTNIETEQRAKADRQAGRKGQQARRKKNGSKMQSAGFYKHPTKKRTISGRVVDR